MSRAEIKEWSKKQIDGNKLEIWKGVLLVGLLTIAIGFVTGLFDQKSVSGSMIGAIGELLLAPAQIGLTAFFINFVKTGEIDRNVIFDYYSQFWKIVGTILLMGIIISVGLIFFIIPGIYLAFSYALVPYLLAERKDLTITETLELSRKMMVGHKFDFFILGLSFIGWACLVPFTLGILIVWLFPYATVATTKFFADIIENYEG